MPCKCSGVRYDRCACRVLSGYQPRNEESVMIVQESACRIQRPPQNNFWISLYRNVYERCTGFNLRYCHFRGVCTKNFLKEALCDMITLMCFLMANLVIFCTIFTRMTLHVSFAMISSARWMRRSFLKKLMAHQETMMLSKYASQPAHNFSPPHKIF